MNELFTTTSVQSKRILYTPSSFARTSLLHLQEVGTLQAIKPHTSMRNNLKSFLFFIVQNGSGYLVYDGVKYTLDTGDCVFIDCRKSYSHCTTTDLWSLKWCHFYSSSMSDIYLKYQERGGNIIFHPNNLTQFIQVIDEIYDIANSLDYIKDMKINELISQLLTLLMEQSWRMQNNSISRKRMELFTVKEYIDENYVKKITLDDLSAKFYINKYYLTKIFKEAYGTTINNYILSKRITHSKQLLRFSDMTVEQIACEVGMNDANYLSRMFKKVEGVSPKEYKKQW